MLRKGLKLLGATIIGVVLLIALAWGLVQTRPGKAWLASEFGRLLSTPDAAITVTGITGVLPFDLQVGRIVLADRDGPYVTVENAALDIALGALLARRLDVRRLAARNVTVARPSAGKESSGGGSDIATLLHPPVAIELDHLDIGTLQLDAPVLGTAMTLALSASGRLGGGQADADLALRRIDGTPGEAALHLAFDGSAPRLDLRATAAEPTGSLLAGLLDYPRPLPLTLDLEGSGPLDGWQGTLDAKAGDAARVASRLHIAASPGKNAYRLSLDGDAEGEKLLPEKLRPLLGGELRFAASAGTEDDAVTLDRLHLASAAVTLDAQGRYGRQDNGLAAKATLALPDLANLQKLAGVEIKGAGDLRLTIAGTLAQPRLDAALTLAEPRVSGNGAGAIAANLSLHPVGDSLTSPIAITGDGKITALALASGNVPAGFGEAITWNLAGQLDPQTRTIALADFSLDDSGATLAASGSFAPGGGNGEARLDLPDLARMGMGKLGGALHLATDFRAAADGSVTAVISGDGERLALGAPQLDAVLGPQMTGSLTLRRDADGSLAAHDVAVTGAAATITAAAQRDAAGRLAADATLALPRLAAVTPQLTGAAQATLHVEGPQDALSGTLALTAPAIAASSLRIDNLAARLTFADLRSGHLEARFRVNGIDATAAADGALGQGNALRVTGLSLAAVGATVSGTVTILPASGAAEGKLAGRIPDLRPWSALAGTTLAGRAQFDATLGSTGGESLDAVFDASDLSSGGAAPATLRNLHLTARLADLLGRPSGRAEITATDADAGKAKISSLKLTGTSDKPGHFALAANATGVLGQPFTLSSAATTTLDRGAIDLRLTQLSGTLAGGVALALRQPLQAAWHGGSASFSGLALGFGTGSLSGDGKLAGSSVSLHLLAKTLPLQNLARLGGSQEVVGALGFELTLSGTRAAPQGELVVDGENLQFAALTRPDLPALSMVADAVWRDRSVQFRGRIAAPQNAAIGFTGSAPLVLDQQALAVQVPRDGAMALHLEGDGELANFADLLPTVEDRIAGAFTINVSIAGTVGAPAASGSLTVAHGRYESLAAGAVLADIGFTVAGDNDKLDLRSFTATDGGTGTLKLSGSVELAATPGPALDLSAQLQKFRAVSRDEGSATVSGDAHLTGPIDSPALAAGLRIEEADLNIPDKLPQAVRPISVVRIDSATGQAVPAPAAAAVHPSLLAVGLNVTVDFPGKTFVRGRGLDSEWQGRIVVTGTSDAPRLTGDLSVVRGTFDILGTTFVLTQGSKASFAGGSKIDPIVAVEAQAQSNDVTAIVKVTGTASQPSINLTSEPALPRDEILSRLLFGTSVSQLTPAQGVQIAAAAASLAGGSDFDLLSKVRRGLGLDRLGLGSAQSSVVPGLGVPSLAATPGQPGSTPAVGYGTTPLAPGMTSAAGATGSTLGGTALNAGKYVADGVYVGVSQGLTTSSSTVNVQVDVTRHLSVVTETGPDSGSGLGISWKLDY